MKIIGFDYDGTIINIEPQKAQAFGFLLKDEWGVDAWEAEKFWIETGGTSRRYKFDHFYSKRFFQKLDDGIYLGIENKFSHILKTKFYPKVTILPNALHLIKFARANFDFMFVSSGVTHEEINYLVRLNGLEKYFDAVYGTNNEYLSKSDHFKEIIENKKPSVKVFVGDGTEDMKVAKQFDFIAIGIPSNHEVEELQKAGADSVANLVDCPDVIEKLIS